MARVNDADLANAEVELSQAKLYSRSGGDLHDANEGGVPINALGGQGLNVVEAPVQDGYVNPSLLRLVYHAFDGRAVAIPDYMARVRLSERFPRETWIPPQWHGKRVWFLEPQPTTTENLNLKCLLHADQDMDVVTEMTAAGIPGGRCTKSNIPSAYFVEKHMELKHKDEWRAIQRFRTEAETKIYRDNQTAQTEAFIKLAEALSTKES
jgi:hypothetical protein